MEPGVKEKEVKKIPYSQDAEMSVLGAMMLQPNSLYKAFSLLKAEDFYLDAHRKIFEAMEHLFNEREAVDVLTVKEELKKRGELESVGGMEYLAELVESSITPALIDQHIEIVLEKSAFRKLIEVATRILDEAYKETMPADALIDLAEHLILTIRERRLKQDFESVGALVKDVFSEINELMLNKNLITGVPSGYRDLDRMTAGFQRGDLVVLASRPSMGKTSFALNILRHLGVDEDVPCAIFSLEMSKEQLIQRLLCMEARVPFQKMRTGYISKKDVPRLTQAADKLQKAPIYIDDTPAIPILELRAKARRVVKEKGVRFIVVDYLQLMQGPKKAENRQQEISALSRSLKALAKELNVPIMALSQLSRAVEQRHDRRPQLSDLRESGAIEQDADTVLFIYRDEVYNPDTEDEGIAEIIIGKQRNGPIGRVKLAFLKEIMRFEPLAEEEEEEVGDYLYGD